MLADRGSSLPGIYASSVLMLNHRAANGIKREKRNRREDGVTEQKPRGGRGHGGIRRIENVPCASCSRGTETNDEKETTSLRYATTTCICL